MSTRTVLEEGLAAGLTTQELYRELLSRLVDDPARDGLAETPERVEKAMAFLTRGYAMDVATVLNGALFEVDYDEMVMVRDIEFFSLCEHHLLPFFGKVHVAYIPEGQGDRAEQDSAAGRDVCAAAAGAGADDAADCGRDSGGDRAAGRGRDVEARHLCMMMRGVEKQHSATVTSAMRGVFKTQTQTRNEFLSLVRHGGIES